MCFLEVSGKAKVAYESSENILEQSVKSAKAAEEVSRQLTDSFGQAQGLETAFSFLSLQLGEVAKTRNDATSYAHQKCRQRDTLKSQTSLLTD